MKEVEAISGIFLKEDKLLLLKRGEKRTFFPGKWDLMGGDVLPEEIPFDALRRDAAHKLNVDNISIRKEGEILICEGMTVPIRRHYYVCEADYKDLRIDHKKYEQFDWFNNQQVECLDLVPGVLSILREADLF